MKLTSLQESLLLLTWLHKQIRQTLIPLEQKEKNVSKGMKFIISNYAIVLICSFLEEWKILESLGRDKEIQITLRMASPFLKRIRKWNGLRKVRSSLLVHTHRDKKGKFVTPWEVFSKYESPTAYAEIILLSRCAISAIEVAYVRHHDEYIQAEEEIQQDVEHMELKGIRTEGELNTELKNLNADMVKIKEKFSKM